MKLPIGLQIFSVRDYARENLEFTLKEIKSMGYDGIELAGFYDKTPEEYASLLKKYDLKAMSAHVPYPEMCNDMSKVIEDCKTVGCEYIAVPWLEPDYRMDGIHGKETADNIYKFAEMVKEAGMGLLYHNHDFEFEKIGGEYVLDSYYAQIPADLLQTELDVCWVNVGGEDPCAYLRKYAGRAEIVHLKDFAGQKSENMYGLIGQGEAKSDESSRFEFRPVGFGRQDMPAIVEAAIACGAKWLVVEQDAPSMGRTPLQCAELSIRYLRSFL